MKIQMKFLGLTILMGCSILVKAQTDPYDDDIYYSSKDKKPHVSHISATDIKASNTLPSNPQNTTGQQYSNSQHEEDTYPNKSGSNSSSYGGGSGQYSNSGISGKNTGDTYITNNYGTDYSTRLKRFYGPSMNMGYYNSFYDYPYGYGYNSFGYNSLGFNSYPYYGSGFSIGYTWGTPGYSCFNSPFCGYNSFGYGYNPYAYNSFGYGGYNGFNNYNNGFYNGYNYGLYNSYNNNYYKPYNKENSNYNVPSTTYGRRYDASGSTPAQGGADPRSSRSSTTPQMQPMQMDKTQTPAVNNQRQPEPVFNDPRGERGYSNSNHHVVNTYERSEPAINNNTNAAPQNSNYQAPVQNENVDPRGERGLQRQAAPQYQYPEPVQERRHATYAEPSYSPAPTYSAPAPSYRGGGGGSSSGGGDTYGRRR